MKLKHLFLFAIAIVITASTQVVQSESHQYYWMKIKAKDKFERSIIANTGVTIEGIKEDYVIAYGSDVELKKIQKLGLLLVSSNLALETIHTKDFPSKDSAFHNYTELTEEITKLANENPTFVKLSSIGKTVEGRDIWVLRIGTDQSHADDKPAIIFMGGHHAREHLSVEMPLMLATYLVNQFKANNSRIVALMNSRDIHIIPVVNADGIEFDVQNGQYKMWRKNRSQNKDGTYGVDLNRNYGFQWGTGGSSTDTNSDVYMGPKAFSEPETQAVKNYIDSHINISTLLSFHTFSQLILYPWGHKFNSIDNSRDLQVHEKMARKMAEWNKYVPQQSSDLYIASGDTTDWSYGVHKIISFTFELDPANSGGNQGFYPGAGVIQPTFNKNIEPCLYLLEYADNPYRVLNVGIGPINP